VECEAEELPQAAGEDLVADRLAGAGSAAEDRDK
jgi:hypothetical protein